MVSLNFGVLVKVALLVIEHMRRIQALIQAVYSAYTYSSLTIAFVRARNSASKRRDTYPNPSVVYESCMLRLTSGIQIRY